MSYYEGWRDIKGEAHVRKVVDGKPRGLRKRLDLDNHSPDGFEWGYGGSGPAQLALALLADALGDGQRAVRLHQQFKWRVIAKLRQDMYWRLSVENILEHARAIEAQKRPHWIEE
jgi:uncharacterized protein (DUF2249 family)